VEKEWDEREKVRDVRAREKVRREGGEEWGRSGMRERR
jgi:hypothetical protein